MKYLQHKKSGFTLIELLVSLTLLSVVVIVAVGLILNTNAQIRQTRADRRVMDNLSFAIEHMSRSIAYGYDYSCSFGAIPFSCPFPSGTQVISFQGNYYGNTEVYTYERRINTAGRGYISNTIGLGGTPVSLTDEALDITELTFYVYDAEPTTMGGTTEQPRIVVAIRGTSYATPNPKTFFIQTTLSQRDLKL